MRSLSSPIIRPVRNPSALQLIRWTLMKLAKQLFFSTAEWAFQTWWEEGGRERQNEGARKKRDRKCEGGQNFLMQSSRLQGTGFPKVPNQGPSSAIFPLLFPSRRRNQFVITLCMPQCSRQPYNLQLWGLLGGREGWSEKKRERERETEGRGIGLKKGERELKRKKNITGSCLV